MERWVWVAPGIPQQDLSNSAAEDLSITEEQHDLATNQSGSDSAVVVDDATAQPSASEPSSTLPEGELPAASGVRVNVIGPLEVESWVEPPTRHKVTEALCFLVLHRKRPITVDVRVIPQPNVQVIHHWAPAILSTPSHLLVPVDAVR
jgi:hypothetical protein